MKQKISLTFLFFVVALFVQANPLKDFWVSSETPLGQCLLELSGGGSAEASLVQASLDFDAYFNWTSKADLEEYWGKLSLKEGKDLVESESVRIIKWILDNKREDAYPEVTTQQPKNIDLLLKQEQLDYDFRCVRRVGYGSYGGVFSFGDGKYVIKIPFEKNRMEDGQNNSLRNGLKLLDFCQSYCREYIDNFIAKYFGTYEHKSQSQDTLFKGDVFENVSGPSFCDYQGETPAKNCRLLAQAATGIAIAHEAGCINLDIKPENMVLNSEGSLLKLVDFGTLIELTQGFATIPKTTSEFAAPEKINFEDNLSPAIDVFSLGVVSLRKIKPMDGACILTDFVVMPDLLKKTYPYEGFVSQMSCDFFDEAEYQGEEPKDFYRKPISERIAVECERLNVLGDKKASKFLGLLVQDCLAYKPEHRISAAQAAEILHVFSSFLEAKEAGIKEKSGTELECPDYKIVKGNAIKNCPKAIPMALRRMLFNPDPTSRQKARAAIIRLVNADPSYENTPSYGMALLLTNVEAFKNWAKEEIHSESLQQLRRRIYIYGSAKSEQDMPVSREIYNEIQTFSIDTK